MLAVSTSLSSMVHGVLLNIHGLGVLIHGPAGIGKSLLALALVDRGHRLVADDQVLVIQDDGTLRGVCPGESFGFLALRDHGLLDIQALYGDVALQRETIIELVVALHDQARGDPTLAPRNDHWSFQGYELTQRYLCTQGEGAALRLDCLVRDQILRQRGHQAETLFAARITTHQDHPPCE